MLRRLPRFPGSPSGRFREREESRIALDGPVDPVLRAVKHRRGAPSVPHIGILHLNVPDDKPKRVRSAQESLSTRWPEPWTRHGAAGSPRLCTDTGVLHGRVMGPCDFLVALGLSRQRSPAQLHPRPSLLVLGALLHVHGQRAALTHGCRAPPPAHAWRLHSCS